VDFLYHLSHLLFYFSAASNIKQKLNEIDILMPSGSFYFNGEDLKELEKINLNKKTWISIKYL